MLDRCRKLPEAGVFDEPKALSNLRSANFIDRLDRAFRLPTSIPLRGHFWMPSSQNHLQFKRAIRLFRRSSEQVSSIPTESFQAWLRSGATIDVVFPPEPKLLQKAWTHLSFKR